MNNKDGVARRQWIGLGVVAILALVVVGVVVIARGGSEDSSRDTEAKRTALCALRDTSDEPLVDPNSSSTREELSAKIRDRAATLMAAADGSSDEVAAVLKASADALVKVADAISADTTGESLADVVAILADDKALAESSATLQQLLVDQCS